MMVQIALSMALTIRDFALHKDKLRRPCRRSGGARHLGAHPVAYEWWRTEERQPSAHALRFGLSACEERARDGLQGALSAMPLGWFRTCGLVRSSM